MKDVLIRKLEEKLKAPLPGREAQYKMAHAVRRSYRAAPPDAFLAGVLALFYPKNADWHIVLIERESSNPKDRHGGQISFPGGRFELQDGSLQNTALREAQEEVGVDPSAIKVIGRLTDLYIPVSNFLVNPFVGYTRKLPSFRPQAEEVRSVLEVPFPLLQKPETVQQLDLRLNGNIVLNNVPYYNIFGKVVWGATAMMLSELLEIVSE